MLRDVLRLAGHPIGRKYVATLIGKMGIEALYRKALHIHDISANSAKSHPSTHSLMRLRTVSVQKYLQ